MYTRKTRILSLYVSLEKKPYPNNYKYNHKPVLALYQENVRIKPEQLIETGYYQFIKS
jgi:hypothetical protein